MNNDNPIYQILDRVSARRRRMKWITLAMMLVGLVFVVFYLNAMFGLPLMIGIHAALTLFFVMLAGHLSLYLLFSVDSYESNYRLKPFFADIVLIGMDPLVIGRGICAKSAQSYRGTMPLWSAGGILLALAIGYSVQFLSEFWVVAGASRYQFSGALAAFTLIGVGACGQLLGLRTYARQVVVPGAWLWYRWIRRSYETRLGLVGRWRFWLAIPGLSFVLALPILGFFFTVLYHASVVAGELFFRHDLKVLRVILPPLVFAAGFVSGWGLGAICRRLMETFESRLTHEIDRLFQLRAILIFERGGDWSRSR